MSIKSIKGSPELAESIKRRRNELELTIEEAALKAEVGTKTWSRYEAGESIRTDKYKGICRALGWRTLPSDESDGCTDFDYSEYKKHKAWSKEIKENYGDVAAISFVIGSDILLDYLQDDLNSLSSLPNGSHIGQTLSSQVEILLPPQFLMKYDYDFLYSLRATVINFRNAAQIGREIIAHSVLEELCIYLIVEEAHSLLDSMASSIEAQGIEFDDDWDGWIFNLFDDDDLLCYLYSEFYLTENDPYHFNHWGKKQFFMEHMDINC